MRRAAPAALSESADEGREKRDSEEGEDDPSDGEKAGEGEAAVQVGDGGQAPPAPAEDGESEWERRAVWGLGPAPCGRAALALSQTTMGAFMSQAGSLSAPCSRHALPSDSSSHPPSGTSSGSRGASPSAGPLSPCLATEPVGALPGSVPWASLALWPPGALRSSTSAI